MPHHTLPKVAIQFGDKERFLCFPNRSLVRIREEFGIDAIKQFGSGGGDLLDVLPVLLWGGLLWADPEHPDTAIKWDPDDPKAPLNKDIHPIEAKVVRNWFLDEGNIAINEGWVLDIHEALTGRRPKVESADPPPSDGEQS